MRAIRLDPDLAKAHIGLCSAYSRASRYLEAIAACQIGIRLRPSSEGYIQLGHVYKFAKLYSEAIKAYRGVFTQEPDNSSAYTASAYFHIGEVYEHIESYEEAIPYLQQAIFESR